jgi:hypothetical protein
MLEGARYAMLDMKIGRLASRISTLIGLMQEMRIKMTRAYARSRMITAQIYILTMFIGAMSVSSFVSGRYVVAAGLYLIIVVLYAIEHRFNMDIVAMISLLDDVHRLERLGVHIKEASAIIDARSVSYDQLYALVIDKVKIYDIICKDINKKEYRSVLRTYCI